MSNSESLRHKDTGHSLETLALMMQEQVDECWAEWWTSPSTWLCFPAQPWRCPRNKRRPCLKDSQKPGQVRTAECEHAVGREGSRWREGLGKAWLCSSLPQPCASFQPATPSPEMQAGPLVSKVGPGWGEEQSRGAHWLVGPEASLLAPHVKDEQLQLSERDVGELLTDKVSWRGRNAPEGASGPVCGHLGPLPWEAWVWAPQTQFSKDGWHPQKRWVYRPPIHKLRYLKENSWNR